MPDSVRRIALPLAFTGLGVYVFYHLIATSAAPDSFLAGLIVLEIVAAALWNYERVFLPLLMIVFLLAGTRLPMYSAALSGRWLVLGAGAVAGLLLYMHRRPSFTALHLTALFCVVAASVSSMTSVYPRIAFLKTGSLLLLFAYAGAGARLAAKDREARFVTGLLLSCELLTFVTAAFYFVGHLALFGNPNSLGAVMAVGTLPILLWGLIVSEGTRAYPRRLVAVIVSLALLLSSYSRAGIGAGLAASFVLCFVFRRYRMLIKGAGICALMAVLVVATVPLPEKTFAHDVTDAFLYKGKSEAGVFGSREMPWKQTAAVIKRYPWFGSGFGTSMSQWEGPHLDLAFQSTLGSFREHGNSYLAILEWTGLLGVIPFALLILLTIVNVGKGVIQLRRTNNPATPLAPLTAVILSGLLHAFFEDWMFAAGYYLCVFFWAAVSVQSDLLSSGSESLCSVASLQFSASPMQGTYRLASPPR
jgi:O-antigen ligase